MNEYAATVVHVFVTSVRHALIAATLLYAMSPQTITNRLQRAMNAAARVVSDTGKFDRGLKTILLDELYTFAGCS